jgi:sulfite reductase (ferredoxin)
MKTADLTISESALFWKEALVQKIPSEFAGFIDEFEMDIFFKKQGKIEDKLFAEARLRMGAYGQRYDHGKRSDGKEDREIPFPNEGLTKGPNTMWDAPGMQRIKIPYGGLNTEQMEVLAELAEEYSDSICHITTRQDIQLHYVHIEDTPTIFRRLAAVGITTREACGNSIRNVTACPYTGVCRDEAFDVTPYADAVFRYLLGHPDVQDFGRKFKIALSGCKTNPCALTSLHDIGLIAITREQDGQLKRGFEFYVGGGLGSVPYKAKLFDGFVPEEELLGLVQAVCRIFARYGEKKKRHRARLKFLVADWGIEKFQQEVLEEKAKLTPDPRWISYLKTLNSLDEQPLKAPGKNIPNVNDKEFQYWYSTNVIPQRQQGYLIVTVTCPLGDVTSNQMRGLAEIARRFVKDTIRTTVDQNLVFRWVSESDIYDLYKELKAINLAEPGAGTIVDVTACPGTDTCKLGVSSSRGLAGVLRTQLGEKSLEMDQSMRDLSVKVSGCFNSCGQHHVADIGFYGISRTRGGYVVPHFNVVLGGQLDENANEYGLSVGALPSKSVPEAVERLASIYLKERQEGEKFREYVERVGKVAIMKNLEDLVNVPDYEADKSYYVDWGDVREYSTRDKGVGECAGEIVSLTDFGLKVADREIFEAQIFFDGGKYREASELAYKSMMHAAQALVKSYNPDITEDAEKVMKEFRERFYDTQLFYDPFAGPKFAQHYFDAHENRFKQLDQEKTNILIQEAQLFIEAAHSCNLRMSMNQK